jgi:adenine/guanine phosphoribosyltransferase-like PRPP-binding protein
VNLELLRECVRRILVEKTRKVKQDAAPSAVLIVDEETLEASFEDMNEARAPGGVTVFSAMTLRAAFVPYTVASEYAKTWGLKPKDVAAFIKKGESLSENGKVQMEWEKPRIRDQFVQRMANTIAKRFEGEKIDEVMPIDSSHPMSKELATLVASRLSVPFVRSVEKEDDPEKINYDEEEILKWMDSLTPEFLASKGVTYDEYVQNTFDLLDKEKKTIKKALINKRDNKRDGKSSIARDTWGAHRKFWNLFKGVEAKGAKRVLVIDDNTASGSTNSHVLKRFKAAGVEPLFAVGYLFKTAKKI